MHRLVTKLGLSGLINEQVPLLKVHLPYHESDHVLNLAYNVLTGGIRLEGSDGVMPWSLRIDRTSQRSDRRCRGRTQYGCSA